MDAEVLEYIARQRNKGKTDDEIIRALLASGWSLEKAKEFINRKDSNNQPPQSNEIEQHITFSQAVIVIGVILILSAIFIIVVYSWSDFPNWAKFLTVALANTLLFITSHFAKEETRKEIILSGYFRRPDNAACCHRNISLSV